MLVIATHFHIKIPISIARNTHTHTCTIFSECMLFYNSSFTRARSFDLPIWCLCHTRCSIAYRLHPLFLAPIRKYVHTSDTQNSNRTTESIMTAGRFQCRSSYWLLRSVTSAQKRASKRWLTRYYSFSRTSFVKNVTRIYKF